MSHYKRKGPFKPFKPFQGKDHIPHLEPDDAVITDLFSIAREGGFSQIQGYINEHVPIYNYRYISSLQVSI